MNEKLETPQYSYWPILLAIGITLIAIGVVTSIVISVFSLLLVFVSLIGWTWENRGEEQTKGEDNEQP